MNFSHSQETCENFLGTEGLWFHGIIQPEEKQMIASEDGCQIEQ